MSFTPILLAEKKTYAPLGFFLISLFLFWELFHEDRTHVPFSLAVEPG